METFSENTPKPKRGRPKTHQGVWLDGLIKNNLGPLEIHTRRGKMDYIYRLETLRAIQKMKPETQEIILGFPLDNVKNGTKPFPPGYDTAATEIGRFIESRNDNAEAVDAAMEILIDARTRGIPWRDIRAHFRKLRLGEKQGNALSLTMQLARALDDYTRKFPATTKAVRVAAIRNLLAIVEDESTE